MLDLVTTKQFELAKIDREASYETAYEDADKLLREGLIISGSEYMFEKIRNIYFDLIETLKNLPSVEDISQEIEMYNCAVMDRAIDIIYRFRRDEYGSSYVDSDFEDAAEETEEDIRSQIGELLWYSNTTSIVTDDDIFEALSFYGLAFIVSHEDRIYRQNAILAMDDAIDVLANDCQEILFPQFTVGWGYNTDPAFIHARIVTNQRREKLLCGI